MEFLVHIEVLWPGDGDPKELERLSAAERARARAAIRSLPFFPWLQVDVHPLAAHPSDPDRPGGA